MLGVVLIRKDHLREELKVKALYNSCTWLIQSNRCPCQPVKFLWPLFTLLFDELFFTFIGSDVQTKVPVSFGGDLDIFKYLFSFIAVLLFDD